MSKLDGFRQLAQRLGTDGARGVSYAVALGAITVLLDTAGLPTEFIEISKGLWINSMSSLLDSLGSGDKVSDEDIRKVIVDSVRQSDIQNLLTEEKYLRSFDRIMLLMRDNEMMTRESIEHLEVIRGDMATRANQEEIRANQEVMFALLGDIQSKLDEFTPPPEPEPEIPSIFISYGRGDDDEDYHNADKSFLRKLYNDLRSRSFNVWWDRESMPSRGLTFVDEIKNAITEHDRLILIVGPHAVNSEYVSYEWRHALSLCKPIIPILLKREPDISDDNDQYGQIPAELKNYHSLNALNWESDPDSYTKLLDELDRILRDKAPMGDVHGIPRLPIGYVQREGFNTIQQALMSKTNEETHAPVVIAPHEQMRTVQGAGGIGKTVLASALGQSCLLRRHFLDGVYWVRLGKWEDVDVVTRQSTLGLALGDKDTTAYMDAEGGRLRLDALLRNRQALIILDDVWDSRQVDAFDALGPNCRLLMTTRKRNILRGANMHQLNKLSDDEGLALIGGWLDRDPEAENPHEAEERRILQLVDGYTLAVAIAGAKLADEQGGYSHESLIRRLEAGRTFEDLTLGDGEQKNESLEIAIKLSYDDLNETDKLRFRRLGVLAPSVNFDSMLVRVLWMEGEEVLDEFEAEDTLNRLVNSGLLDRDETGRWEQHTILRAYAEALLSDEEELGAFARYVAFAVAAASQLNQIGMEQWDTQIGPDYPHVDYVGDTLIERCPQDKVVYQHITGEFIWAVQKYVNNRPVLRDGKWRGLDWFELGVSIYAETDQLSKQATVLSNIASVWRALGELHIALDFANRALVVQRNTDDKSGEAIILNNIGVSWQILGETHQALDFHNQALSIQREVGDKSGEATTLNNIGRIWRQLGDNDKALETYKLALPIHRDMGNKSGEETTLNNIGRVWQELGDSEKALDFYKQSLEIVQNLGTIRSEATSLSNIAGIYSLQGDFEKAKTLFLQILEMFQDIGAVTEIATTLDNLAAMCAQMGNINDAITYLEQSITILSSRELTQDLDGITITQRETFLRNLKAKRDGKAIPNLSTEHTNTLVQNTIAVSTSAQASKSSWRESLVNLREAVEKDNLPVEIAFMSALIDVVDGNTPTLPDDNPYQLYLQEVLDGIANYDPDAVEILSEDTLNPTIQQTIRVCTSATDQKISWRETLDSARDVAERENNANELAFFTALIDVIDGKTPTLPDDNPYQPYLQQMLDGIANYDPDADSEDDIVEQLATIYMQQGQDAVREIISQTNISTDQADQLLEQVRQQALENFKTLVKQMLDTAGEDRVRELLSEQGYDDDLINAIIADAQGDATPRPPIVQPAPDPTPTSQSSQVSDIIDQLIDLMASEGESAVREVLHQSNITDEQADQLISQVKAQIGRRALEQMLANEGEGKVREVLAAQGMNSTTIDMIVADIRGETVDPATLDHDTIVNQLVTLFRLQGEESVRALINRTQLDDEQAESLLKQVKQQVFDESLRFLRANVDDTTARKLRSGFSALDMDGSTIDLIMSQLLS